MLDWILDHWILSGAIVGITALIVALILFLRRYYLIRYVDLAPICFESDRQPQEAPTIGRFPIEPELINFAAFAPRSITPNCTFILDIWAYLPFQYSRVSEMARALGRDVNVGYKAGVPISRGAILTIKVDIAQLSVEDPVDTFVWNDEPANASFIIGVPVDTPSGNYPGKALISCEGLPIAKLVFLIAVSTIKVSNYVDRSSEVVYHKTAFASYASENREEVLSRIHGMKKVAPYLDIFIDLFSLRSGENWQAKLEQHVPTQDTFFLFWSHYAARSVWVKREWKLALQKRGLDYIDPVPLEDPDHAPPPPELRSLHFSDAYVAYIQYQRLKEKEREIKKDWERRLRTVGRCDAGHRLDPNWETCPYCESERR
jgi:TIR domain